ncbi:MAG: hypothetical protein ACLFV7_05420 [Phycisphaerae bacterium]
MSARHVLTVLLPAMLLASCNPSSDESAYEKGFDTRAQFVLRSIAQDDPNEVADWAIRVVGDPHKYTHGPILATLATDAPNAPAIQALRKMVPVNRRKGDRGLYHFAAYYRARLYLQFRDQLPPDVVTATEQDVREHLDVMTRGGTENHGFMHRTSGYIFTEYVDGPYPPGERTSQAWLRQWLKDQVDKFYTAGQGEYDSSTYVTFTAAGWTNIFDYTRNPGMKKLSRAALEWLATSQAVKYFHGCNMGPESRGFATGAVETNTDRLNWLWWDDSARPVIQQGFYKLGRFVHAVAVPALSSYRPHRVIRRIARKQVPLPFEVHASKPQYYPSVANKDQEYLYINRHYAMGTLYSPEKGVRVRGTILPQTTMFKAALLDANDVRVFGMSNGYHRHFPLEGRTPYDQHHQKRSAAVNICHIQAEEDVRTKHRSLLGYPKAAGEPVKDGEWYFWQVGDAYLAARPLNGKASPGVPTVPDKGGKTAVPVKTEKYAYLISPGRLTGWVVQLGQKPRYADLAAFRKAVLARCKLDTSLLRKLRTVTFTSLEGDALKIRHTGGPGGRPEAYTNGNLLMWENWPVYDSPYVKQAAGSGVLRLTDGTETLTIDVTGEWPTFGEGKAE